MVRIDVVRYFFIGQLVFGSCLTMHAMEIAREHVMYRAVKENDLYTVKKLLADGFNTESEMSPDGCTLLFVAVQASFPDMIRFLLAQGASPNRQTSKKYLFVSPFVYALIMSPSAIVALFFEETAKIKPAEQYMGDKPAKFARVMPKSYMLKCYEKDNIPQYDYSLRLAICSKLDALEKVKLLVTNGFNLNVCFLHKGIQYYPCEYAERWGYKEAADYLRPLFEKTNQAKLEKIKKRLKKLLKPLPYRNVPGLVMGAIGKFKPDIKMFFVARKKQQLVAPDEYCLVQ